MDIVSYHEEFRTALFLSSLTLGTFLFTMKTFIIQTIKKEVYDHPRHQELAEDLAKDRNEEPSYYCGLKNLSSLILQAIVLALINAFIQISVGYIGHPATASACLISSIISWLAFSRVLFEVGRNMSDMFDYAERDATKSSGKPVKESK
jgi:hypothetical protein